MSGVAALLDGRVSGRRVNDVLAELTRSGVVAREPAGAAFLYRLNRDHLAADAVLELANLRARLLHAIRDEVQTWKVHPIALWLFGSAARGDGGLESDVDLFVLRAATIDSHDLQWLDQFAELEQRIHAWTGNAAVIVEYDENEFVGLVSAHDPLVANLRADAIDLFGETVAGVVRRIPSQ